MTKRDQNSNSYSRRNTDRVYRLDVDTATANSLRAYMQQELLYHNSLITAFNAKLRVLGPEIESLKESRERLWLLVAQTKTDLRELAKIAITEWPDQFKTYSNLIVSNGKLAFDNKMMMLFDIATSKGIIHPTVRRNIAAEILKWIQPQVKIINESELSLTGQMRSAIVMLQPATEIVKRHLQLSDDCFTIVWDDINKCSKISVPYSKTPLIINEHNLAKIPHNYIIIRQKPGRNYTFATPWQIVVKDITANYVLDMFDSFQPTRR